MNNVFLEGEKEMRKEMVWRIMQEILPTIVLKALMPQGEPKKESRISAIGGEGWISEGIMSVSESFS